MGMNAMILHVIGDALGNLGVIIAALIIWLTDSPHRFYADPAISLIITLIILKTALPLVKATSKILLQATPDHIDIKNIREDIEDLPGVVSCHHIHVWQLSDTKLVCSLHMQVAFPISEGSGEKYMALARRARKCLHAYGIHSSTIQPEFGPVDDGGHAPVPALDGATETAVAADGSSTDGMAPMSCLLECVDDCMTPGCCKMGSRPASSRDSSHSLERNGEARGT
jgi:solute carrier family 30 (zinc transporter), member 1